jgi:hypothetical protein
VKAFVLSAGALLLGVLVAIGGYPLSGLMTPSAYASEPTPDLEHAATNGSTVVGADSAGRLWWSDGDGEDGTWVDSGVALGKNGVTSLIWTGERFIATSFFLLPEAMTAKTGQCESFRWVKPSTRATSSPMTSFSNAAR